jgi:P pilus assembly chaperone PapD
VVHNGSNHATQAIITREDWDRAADGQNRFLPSGSTPHSCGPALSFFPAAFLIEPGANQVVRLAVEKVSGTPRECWDIVFVQEVAQTKQFTRSGLQFVFRTGVKVYVAPTGLTRDASITSMSLEQRNPGQRRISIQFRNSGEVHLAAKGRVEIRRADNSVVAEVPISEFPTLPGAVRQLEVNVPSTTLPGNYVALALIDFGGSEIAAGELELTLH